MNTAFLILGLILLGISLATAGLVMAWLFPGFAPEEPDREQRFRRFLQYWAAERRLRSAWRAVRYLGFTGLVWIVAGLLFSLLPEPVRTAQVFANLVMPLVIYLPPLIVFLYDERKKRRSE